MTLVDSFVGLEAMARYLRANGFENRIEDGAVVLDGRRIARITMNVGGSMWFAGRGPTVRVGPVPIYSSASLPVQTTYWLDVDPAKDPESFRLKLNWERDGLFGALGDIASATFLGGKASERLNAHPDRVLKLARCMRRFERLTVEPEVGRAQLRVVHQQKMQARFSLLGGELFDLDRHLPPIDFFAGLEWVAEALGGAQRRRHEPKAKADRVRSGGPRPHRPGRRSPRVR